MTTNINRIAGMIKQWPLQSANRYRVFINGPLGAMFPDMTINCNSIPIPGRSFDTSDYYHYGPVRKIPSMEVFDNITMVFYLRESFEDFQYFYKWQELMGGGDRDYGLAYYDDIIGRIVISPINANGQSPIDVVLYEAYPVIVGDIQMDYSSQNTIANLPVTWAYHHHEIKQTSTGDPGRDGHTSNILNKVNLNPITLLNRIARN